MSVEDSLSSLKLFASMSSFYVERILASLSLLLGYEFPCVATILTTLSKVKCPLEAPHPNFTTLGV